MRDLDNITLYDLLPPNFINDPHCMALSAALRAAFDIILRDSDEVLVYPIIDKLGDDQLDKLALQWSVQGYKDSLPLTNKRKLVKRGLVAQLYAGTATVVKDKLSDAFSDDAQIREWFEYGGDPYLFAVDIETSNGMDTRRLADVESLVRDVKNARSHLDYLAVTLTHDGQLFLGGVAMAANEITIEPFAVRSIISEGSINMAGWTKGWQSIVIEPQADKEIIIEAGVQLASELSARHVITVG